MKQECDNEETDAVNVYEEVIASLSRQIEDLSNSVDCLRQSDQNLRLSLRLAEQRAMESEIKLRHALDRCVCVCVSVCIYYCMHVYIIIHEVRRIMLSYMFCGTTCDRK